jgi:hypothetical protein
VSDCRLSFDAQPAQEESDVNFKAGSEHFRCAKAARRLLVAAKEARSRTH